MTACFSALLLLALVPSPNPTLVDLGIPDHSEHGFRGNLNADSGAK